MTRRNKAALLDYGRFHVADCTGMSGKRAKLLRDTNQSRRPHYSRTKTLSAAGVAIPRMYVTPVNCVNNIYSIHAHPNHLNRLQVYPIKHLAFVYPWYFLLSLQ